MTILERLGRRGLPRGIWRQLLTCDPDKTTAATNSFPIVAVGASAGGLEAFSQFLRAIPNNAGMAFVFIQHLDPKHHSMLSELLAKTANMPVLEAADGTSFKPNQVYVIPPNVNMGIKRHRLQLTPRDATPGLHTPIDFFMRSLAEERNSRSVGVVLSGTASDGTRGLAAIKAEGGITFAQDENSASIRVCLTAPLHRVALILLCRLTRSPVNLHGSAGILILTVPKRKLTNGSRSRSARTRILTAFSHC